MKMKDLCQKSGISERTIRYYISDGVFVPEKYSESYTGRKTYDYTENDLKRLEQIALLRKYDFSIKDIKEFFDNSADICSVLKANIEKVRRETKTQNDNIAVMEKALSEKPENVDELCAALSNSVIEQAPIPQIDEQSAYKPMYTKTKKRNTLFIVLVSVFGGIAAIALLAVVLFIQIFGISMPSDVDFMPKHVFCEPVKYYKENEYYEYFEYSLKAKYNLNETELKELYNNADDYVEVTILGDLVNRNTYNVYKVYPQNVMILDLDKADYRIGWQKNGFSNWEYYQHYYAEDVQPGYTVDILMKTDDYNRLVSENKLDPEDIHVILRCAMFNDPGYDKITVIEGDESFLRSFEIVKNSEGTDCVVFHCSIMLYNDSNKTQVVTLKGDFKEDCNAGLIKERYLTACYEKDHSIDYFYIPPQDFTRIDVCFIGTAAGKTTQKQNRLLPKLSVEYFAVDTESETEQTLTPDYSYDVIIYKIVERLSTYQYTGSQDASQEIAKMTSSEFIGDKGSGRYIYAYRYDEHLTFEVYDLPVSSCVFYYDGEYYYDLNF